MRALSFILAIAFVLGVPMHDVSTARGAVPSVGTFVYTGSPISLPATAHVAAH